MSEQRGIICAINQHLHKLRFVAEDRTKKILQSSVIHYAGENIKPQMKCQLSGPLAARHRWHTEKKLYRSNNKMSGETFIPQVYLVEVDIHISMKS